MMATEFHASICVNDLPSLPSNFPTCPQISKRFSPYIYEFARYYNNNEWIDPYCEKYDNLEAALIYVFNGYSFTKRELDLECFRNYLNCLNDQKLSEIIKSVIKNYSSEHEIDEVMEVQTLLCCMLGLSSDLSFEKLSQVICSVDHTVAAEEEPAEIKCADNLFVEIADEAIEYFPPIEYATAYRVEQGEEVLAPAKEVSVYTYYSDDDIGTILDLEIDLFIYCEEPEILTFYLNNIRSSGMRRIVLHSDFDLVEHLTLNTLVFVPEFDGRYPYKLWRAMLLTAMQCRYFHLYRPP